MKYSSRERESPSAGSRFYNRVVVRIYHFPRKYPPRDIFNYTVVVVSSILFAARNILLKLALN